ncbi:MAG: hypothetical protein OEW42_10020 [Acidimicrobiia bacterium]|nr:hypothetical protein [Acidimicrobiia bacterium]
MPMQRVVLHIGTHKTGTTLLQRLLSENHDLLRAAGVLHPQTGIPQGHNNAHRDLMLAIRKEDNGKWEELSGEIEQAGLPTVVLSAEELCRCDRHQVARIQQKLDGFEAEIICYFRNEWDFMLAACRQQWKDGSFAGTFPEFLEAKLPRCRYEKYVERWIDVFGAERVHVVLYDKAVQGPGLIDDFVGRLGFTPEVEAIMVQALQRPRKALNASSDDAVAMTQRRITALEQRLSPRLKPTGGLQRLRRTVRRQGLAGRVLVAAAHPRQDMSTDADIDWLREHTAGWHQLFLDRFVDPADHHYLDF